MKIIKYILGFQILTLMLVANTNCIAQVADSIKYDNGFLYYHEYGSKNLPAIILLTGGPGNSYSQLIGLAETLSSEFRSILPEQRGTGKSIPTPFDSTTINLKSITQDLKNLMDSLNLNKSVLIGHSWGGMLAMNFAAQYPENVEHLILIAPGPHKDVKTGFKILFTNRNHTRSFEEELRLNKLNELVKTNKADSAEIIESQILARRAYIFANPVPDSIFQKINAEKNSKTAAVLTRDLYRNYDVSKSLNNYTGQIDIIAGRQDVVGFFSYELKQDIPKVNIHWINECGHFPMYEQPKEFYNILFTALEKKQDKSNAK